MDDKLLLEKINIRMNKVVLFTLCLHVVSCLCLRLFCLHRNEKRKMESTGGPPTWQYYHEVNELLGSHVDNSMDMNNLDDTNMANSTSNSEFIRFARRASITHIMLQIFDKYSQITVVDICNIIQSLALTHPSNFSSLFYFFHFWNYFTSWSTCIEEEIVSIGDSGSENEYDESQYGSGDNHSNVNGHEYPQTKKARLLVTFSILIQSK